MCISLLHPLNSNAQSGPEEGRTTDHNRFRTDLLKALWAETNPSEYVSELAFGAQLREDRIDLEIHQPDVTFFNRSLQPLERLLVIAESAVNRSHGVGRNIALALQLL